MRRAGRTGRKRRRSARGGGRWAELPKDLLLLVLDRLPSVVDLGAFAGVCRSWRALAARAVSASVGGGRPPLLLKPVLDPLVPRPRPGGSLSPRSWRLLSPADPAASYRCSLPPSTLDCHFLGYSHGHLIFYRRGRRRPELADFVTGQVLRLPKLPRLRHIQHGVLTAPLSAPDCSLLLCGFGGVLLRWRVGETGYSEHNLGSYQLGYNPITVFRGQLFTVDFRCRLFAIEFSPHFSVRELDFESNWVGYDLPGMNSFHGQLIECGGELLFVLCIKSGVFIEEVEVLRLDLSGPPSWVKVETLGGAALFLNAEHGSCASCPNPSSWGGRSNCIYLAQDVILGLCCLWMVGQQMCMTPIRHYTGNTSLLPNGLRLFGCILVCSIASVNCDL